MENKSYNASNLAVIILSAVSLVYILYSASFPTTVVANLSETFIKDWRGCSVENPCKTQLKIEIPSRKTNSENSAKGVKFPKTFDYKFTYSDVNIKKITDEMVEKINNSLENESVLAKTYIEEGDDDETREYLLSVSDLKGGHVILSLKNEEWEAISKEKLNGDPVAFFQNYFSTLTMPFILFGMIFYLVRSSIPHLNSATMLADRTKNIKEGMESTLSSFQDMDKFIYIEALSRIFKDNKALLEEFEANKIVNKITIVSKDLASDLIDKDLQEQIITNLLRGVKYRWLISNESGREPLDQLIFALKEVINSHFNDEDQREKNLFSCLKCMNFYSVNKERFYSLPYELNFYSMEGKTHLVVFEGENKIDLTNCSKVRPIKKMISSWMREARDCNQEIIYFDSCNGVTTHIIHKNGVEIPIDEKHHFYKNPPEGVNYYSTNSSIN
jgi:hypothetical protein